MSKSYKKHKYPGVRPGRREGAFVIDYTDHNRARRQVTFKGTEAEANSFRNEILASVNQIERGFKPPPEKLQRPLNLWQLWNKFFEERQLRVRSGSMRWLSLERYRNSVEALFGFRPDLKNKRIDKLDAVDLEGFKVYRKEKGFSSEGINTNLRNLRTILKFAVDRGFLDRSPFLDVPFVSVRKKDVRYLDEEELERLNETLESLDIKDEFQRDARDLIIFYLFTGARTSEILHPSFSWDCIGKDIITFPETKSSKSRVIPIQETVRKLLNDRKGVVGGPFYTAFNQRPEDMDDCIGWLDRHCLTRDMVYNRVKSVFDRAQIKHASTHTLRKTAGAWYYMATRDIFATSRFLGHSSVKVTEQHYVGLIQGLQVENAQYFETALTGRLQYGCNFGTKQDKSGPIEKNLLTKKNPLSLDEKTGIIRSGTDETRTRDLRLDRPAF